MASEAKQIRRRYSYATRYDSTLHEYSLRRFDTAEKRDAWANEWAPYGETRAAVTAADARVDFPHAFASRAREVGEWVPCWYGDALDSTAEPSEGWEWCE